MTCASENEFPSTSLRPLSKMIFWPAKKKELIFFFLGRRHQRSPTRRKGKKKSFFLFSFSSGGGFLRGVNLAKFGNFHWREEETGKKEGVQGGQNMFVFPPISYFSFFGRRRDMNGGNSADFHPKKGKVKHFFPLRFPKKKRGVADLD